MAKWPSAANDHRTSEKEDKRAWLLLGQLVFVVSLPIHVQAAQVISTAQATEHAKPRVPSNMNNITAIDMKDPGYIKASDTVLRIVNHPAFEGFSQFLFPGDKRRLDGEMQLSNIGSLLPYHGHIHADTTVEVLNYLIDEVSAGRTVFHDFYTQGQKQEDPAKQATGLFFFRGNPGAPFAVVCPGGGFSYVGSIHEGFPHALELSRRGYNAFVLTYRVGSELRATEDLAAAVSYVFAHAQALGVGSADYSLWGGSAGARMVANIGSRGAFSFGGNDVPKPAILVLAYTGHSAFSKTDPPTFVMVSEDDPIVNVSTVERRIQAMRSAGIDVEYHKYENAGHGFGLGIGTDAEGWIKYAIRFWEKHMHLPMRQNAR